MWGDSHAMALVPALDDELKRRGICCEVWVQPGNLPGKGVAVKGQEKEINDEAIAALSDVGKYVAVDVQSMNTVAEATTGKDDEDDDDDGSGVRLYQSIYETAMRNKVPAAVIEDMVRIYSYDVDFQRKVQPGDTFDLVFAMKRAATGETETVRWVGQRQVNIAGLKRPAPSRPVRIKAHAFGLNQPQRDLLVSPAHIVAVDGVVISAFFLINGASIVQEPCDSVNYFHIECDRHVLVMAENVPSESYLDQGGRSFFSNAETVALHPEVPQSKTVELGLPASTRKTTLAIRRRLRERAELMGFKAEQFIEPA